MLAVLVINTGEPTGPLASFSDGRVTSTASGWKCITGTVPSDWYSEAFEDSSWPAAVEYGPSNVKCIAAGAQWIATSDRNADKTYCRRKFGMDLVILY